MSEEGMPKQLQMGQDAIPDLLRVGSIPSNTEANVDTDILEPVIFSESFIRYQLVNKGFLNPYSRLTFQLENVSSQSASNLRSFLPINVGVASIIKSARLKIGNQTIQEIEDFTDYYGYKSLFVNNEVQKEREQYLSGRSISHSQFYEDTNNITVNEDLNIHTNLDNGKEYVSNASGVTSGLLVHDFSLINNKPVFSITLEELLPVFRNTAFPLYMLNNDMPVQIELELQSSTDGSRIGMNGALNGSGNRINSNVPFTLNRNECRMIADYTTYSQSLMDSYASKNKNMNWTFMDYQLTKLTLANSVAGENVIRNVGGAGRLVPRMFVAIASDGANPSHRIVNRYSSEANASTGATYGQLTSNIKKNDRFIFPIDRSNTALHFHGLADAEGMVPFVLRDEYSRQGGRIGDEFFEVNSQNVNLQGKFFYTAYKMPDGERVNSRGLELHSKMVSLPAGSYTMRCYIEAIKVATLQDGVFDCYYA